MRSVQELLADLLRLEGSRFDETIFELVRRGPKALERLFVQLESDNLLHVSAKADESIERQWTRIQEILVELPPRAFESPGVKALLKRGPEEAIARRAGECIEQGMIETAACIATALASSGRRSSDQAILEARLSLAVGNPGAALERLDPCYQRGIIEQAAAEWMAAASVAAGDPGRASLIMLSVEPNVAQMADAVASMIDAYLVDDLAACIHEVALRRNPQEWEVVSQAIEAAWKRAVQEDGEAAVELAGIRSELEEFLDAIDSVLLELESCPNASVRSCISGELDSIITRVAELIDRIAGKYNLSLRSDGGKNVEAVSEREMELPLSAVDQGRWGELLASAQEAMDIVGPERLGKSVLRQEPPAEFRRVALLAHAQGRPLSTRWVGGKFHIDVGIPILYERATDHGMLDATSIMQVLKSGTPREGAQEIIGIIRRTQRWYAQTLLDSIGQMLQTVIESLNGLSGSLPEFGRAQTEKVRVALDNWNDEVMDYTSKALGEAEAREESPSSDSQAAADRLEALGCSDETVRAFAVSHHLVSSTESDALSSDQAALICFLIRKAIETEAESGFAEVLADYRLRPAVLRASEERGKRRRRISAKFANETLALVPEGISRERIVSGLDRLVTRVVDGSTKPLTGEMLLMGLAFICFDPLDDPDKSAEIGSALVSLDSACSDAEKQYHSFDWRKLLQSADSAIELMASVGDGP